MIHYVEENRKELPSDRVKFNPTKGKCQKGYGQPQGKNRTCQEVNPDSMTEQLQIDQLDRYEGVQAQIHQVSQFDDSNAVSTTYLDRIERARWEIIKCQELFLIKDQSTAVGTLLDSTDCKLLLDSGAIKGFRDLC